MVRYINFVDDVDRFLYVPTDTFCLLDLSTPKEDLVKTSHYEDLLVNLSLSLFASYILKPCYLYLQGKGFYVFLVFCMFRSCVAFNSLC